MFLNSTASKWKTFALQKPTLRGRKRRIRRKYLQIKNLTNNSYLIYIKNYQPNLKKNFTATLQGNLSVIKLKYTYALILKYLMPSQSHLQVFTQGEWLHSHKCNCIQACESILLLQFILSSIKIFSIILLLMDCSMLACKRNAHGYFKAIIWKS